MITSITLSLSLALSLSLSLLCYHCYYYYHHSLFYHYYYHRYYYYWYYYYYYHYYYIIYIILYSIIYILDLIDVINYQWSKISLMQETSLHVFLMYFLTWILLFAVWTEPAVLQRIFYCKKTVKTDVKKNMARHNYLLAYYRYLQNIIILVCFDKLCVGSKST